MFKYFRKLAGRSFYCEKDGAILTDDNGNYKQVPEGETEGLEEVAVDDESVQEVEKMLAKAVSQVMKDNSDKTAETIVSTQKEVQKFFETIEGSLKEKNQVALTSNSRSAIDLEKLKEDRDAFLEKKSKSFVFTIKNADDLKAVAKAVSVDGSLDGDVIEGDRVPEITRDPVRQIFIEQIADTTTIDSDHLSYVEVTNESGAPLPTAELGLISQKDFEFKEFKTYLKKITVMNKHSVEILKDGPQLISAIRGWLQEDVNIVTDQKLLTGDGQGDNPLGVFSIAEELDATAIGSKRVEFANLYDVIRVAVTKAHVAGKGKFIPTHVLLNPEDADALDLIKDENGQYILPPFRSADGTTIKGARVIENVGIEEGKFLVGDFRKFHIGLKGGVEVEITNSDGDDFSRDIISIKMRKRVASYIRQNDNGAFWTGDISDVISYLTAS